MPGPFPGRGGGSHSRPPVPTAADKAAEPEKYVKVTFNLNGGTSTWKPNGSEVEGYYTNPDGSLYWDGTKDFYGQTHYISTERDIFGKKTSNNPKVFHIPFGPRLYKDGDTPWYPMPGEPEQKVTMTDAEYPIRAGYWSPSFYPVQYSADGKIIDIDLGLSAIYNPPTMTTTNHEIVILKDATGNDGYIVMHTRWRKIAVPGQRTVTYYTDGLALYPDTDAVLPGAKITPPSLTMKEGEVFSHWEYEGSPVNFAEITMPDKDIQLTLKTARPDVQISLEYTGFSPLPPAKTVTTTFVSDKHEYLWPKADFPDFPPDKGDGSIFIGWKITATQPDKFHFLHPGGSPSTWLLKTHDAYPEGRVKLSYAADAATTQTLTLEPIYWLNQNIEYEYPDGTTEVKAVNINDPIGQEATVPPGKYLSAVEIDGISYAGTKSLKDIWVETGRLLWYGGNLQAKLRFATPSAPVEEEEEDILLTDQLENKEYTAKGSKHDFNGATKMVVTRVDGKNIDIRFEDKNGDEVKTLGPVKITMPIPEGLKPPYRVKVEGKWTTFEEENGKIIFYIPPMTGGEELELKDTLDNKHYRVAGSKHNLNGAVKLIATKAAGNTADLKLYDENDKEVHTKGYVAVYVSIPENIQAPYRLKIDGKATTFEEDGKGWIKSYSKF